MEIQPTFRENGFVALPSFVEGDELAELQSHVNRFLSEVLKRIPSERVFYEENDNPTTLKQIQHMYEYDAWFRALFVQGPFRQLAEQVLDGPVIPKNLQYFNKPPQVGPPTPAHQDGFYFMLAPCEAVTMWLALDDVDEENGCVRYVPGSHLKGMRNHSRTQTLGFSQGISDYPTVEDKEQELAISAAPGDLLVHHALTIHRADANQSRTRSRRALGFIYYSELAREDTEAHAAYQRKLSAELKAQGKIS